MLLIILNGTYRFDYPPDFSELDISEKNFDMCIEFIIESYFQLEDKKLI